MNLNTTRNPDDEHQYTEIGETSVSKEGMQLFLFDFIGNEPSFDANIYRLVNFAVILDACQWLLQMVFI